MYWIYLMVAGCFETFWAIALKESHGFSRPLPTVLTFIGMAVSFYLLAKALKGIPLGVGYAVWTGIGAFATAVFAMVTGAEPVSVAKVALLVGLVGCIAGLRIVSA